MCKTQTRMRKGVSEADGKGQVAAMGGISWWVRLAAPRRESQVETDCHLSDSLSSKAVAKCPTSTMGHDVVMVLSPDLFSVTIS
jgi:hypothetical protein